MITIKFCVSLKMETGIYLIENLVDGKIYVGSTSRSFNKRKNEHWKELRRGIHTNGRLQRAWNKYGESHFIFEKLELVDKTNCILKEQYWLDILLPFDTRGYNIRKIAHSNLGVTFSKEHIQKLRMAKLGTKWSEVRRNAHSSKKASQRQRSRYYKMRRIAQIDKDTGEILAYWKDMAQLVELGGFSKSPIANVLANRALTSQGYSWKYEYFQTP